MSFYQQLLDATADERAWLMSAPIIQDCQRGRVSLARYVAFLTQAYHHVKHTVPLLMACGSRLGDEHRWLQDAITEYIDEERGHDHWILSDLAACGVDADRVRHGQPVLATELMVAYAYDCIQRRNPVGFFGMVFVLEGTSVNLATPLAQIIQQQLQLPEQAMSYLYSHGSLDQQHIRFFQQLVDRLEREADRQAVLHTAKVMYRLYGEMFHSLPMED